MLKTIFLILLGLFALAAAAIAGVTVWVQREAPHLKEALFSEQQQKALILYHPSRDAHFSDELSIALAKGFHDTGMSVDRETMTAATPARPDGYAVIAVVTNTYYGSPDRPTLHYLERARFGNTPTIGIAAGAGSTEGSQRILDKQLKMASTDVVDVRSFWISRPNDEKRMQEPNRAVAAEMARTWGTSIAMKLVSNKKASEPAPPLDKAPAKELVQ